MHHERGQPSCVVTSSDFDILVGVHNEETKGRTIATMGDNSTPRPGVLDRIQACPYREYPLSEGALVSELRSLIQANLPDDLFLKCEITYNKLARSIAGRARADIVVANKIEKQKGRFVYSPSFVMEFKRALAPTREINKDFLRLAALKAARPNVRTFLLVLSEAGRVNRFVDERGKSRVGTQNIPNSSSASFSVQKTLKAAPAFSNRDSAHYASIIEVYE
jgi:hypothetical protein